MHTSVLTVFVHESDLLEFRRRIRTNNRVITRSAPVPGGYVVTTRKR